MIDTCIGGLEVTFFFPFDTRVGEFFFGAEIEFSKSDAKGARRNSSLFIREIQDNRNRKYDKYMSRNSRSGK